MSEAYKILSAALDEAITDAWQDKSQLKQNTMSAEIEVPQEHTPVERKSV